MRNIKIKDFLTLNDNNEYMVVSKANYKDKKYYFLIDTKNLGNIKFCYEDGEYLAELNDKDIATELLPLFYNSSKEVLDSEQDQ